MIAIDQVWKELSISRSWLRGFVALLPKEKWIVNAGTSTPSVRCRICGQIRSLNAAGSAYNVTSHLKQHGVDTTKIAESERTVEKASSIVAEKLSKTHMISDAFHAPRVPRSHLQKTVELELAIAQWAVAKGLPWNAFTGAEWHTLKQMFDTPHVVDGDQLRRRVCVNLKLILEEEVRKMLAGLKSVGLTADGWSDKTLGMTSVTISWADQSYKIHTIPIAAHGHIRTATGQALQEAWATATYMDLMS